METIIVLVVLALIAFWIVGIFNKLGFDVATGPEMETEYYNFDALNTPADELAGRNAHQVFQQLEFDF